MRLIDADALIAEWYKLNNIGPEDSGARFVGYQEIARLINNAPTVSGHGDYISRADAVKEIHKYFVKEIDKTPTKVDEDGDEVYTDMATVNSLLVCNKEISKAIKALPSAEPSGDKGGDAEMRNDRTYTHAPYMQQSPNDGADLISRADAIEAWDKLSKRGRTEFDQVLMTLQSADAKGKKENDGFNTCNNNNNNADADYKSHIRLIDNAPSAEADWIPCSERLPKEYAQYLVCLKSGECYVYWLEDSDWARDMAEKEGILAWMPLPKPYREGGEA